MTKRALVEVRQTVRVTVDETKFDEQFMAEFRESFYPFHSLEEHVEHLGQLFARGHVDNMSFIEGYGPAKDMGIKFDEVTWDQEIPGTIETVPA